MWHRRGGHFEACMLGHPGPPPGAPPPPPPSPPDPPSGGQNVAGVLLGLNLETLNHQNFDRIVSQTKCSEGNGVRTIACHGSQRCVECTHKNQEPVLQRTQGCAPLVLFQGAPLMWPVWARVLLNNSASPAGGCGGGGGIYPPPPQPPASDPFFIAGK